MKLKYYIGLLALTIIFGCFYISSAAPVSTLFRNIIPEQDSIYDNGTSTAAWKHIYVQTVCLTGDTCRTTWPAGGAGSVGNWFTGTSNYNSTSTTIGFLSGLFSTASSTFTNTLTIATTTSGCATFSNVGLLFSTGSACGTGAGGTFPFTVTTNYGATANATNTPIWFQQGLQASSTSQIAYASTTVLSASNLVNGKCVQASTGGMLTTTSSACGAGSTGTLQAETPSGTINSSNTVFTTTNQPALVELNGAYQAADGIDYTLTGSGPYTITFVNPPVTGSVLVSLYGNAANTAPWPFTPDTNYNVAVQSTSTPLWFKSGIFASSTSYIANLTIPTTTAGCATFSNIGVLYSTGSACGSGGGSAGNWFTGTTNYGALTNSTSTPVWFQAGLQASSTSRMSTTTFVGNVGIGTTSPYKSLSVVGDIYSEQTWATGIQSDTLNPSSADQTIFFWYPYKGAFRAGEWDIPITNANIGDDGSAAFGYDTVAKGTSSFSTGVSSQAIGITSFVTGDTNVASGTDSFIGGGKQNETSNNALYGAVLGGRGNVVRKESAVIVGGEFNQANGEQSLVWGNSAQTTANALLGLAFGDHSYDAGDSSFAIGEEASSTCLFFCYAIGNLAGAYGTASMALGQFVTANNNGTVAIGHGVSATQPLMITGVDTFGLGLNSNIPTLTVTAAAGADTIGNVGVGTTSPFGLFAIHAKDGGTNTTLFSVASSTGSVQTTLFSISNTGSTTLGVFGACNGSKALTTSATGIIQCGSITGGSGVWPFTTSDTNYNVAVQSTTTPEWFKTPVSGIISLMASSTAVLTNATTTLLTSASTTWLANSGGNVGIGATSSPSSILAIQGVANFVANAVSTIYNGLRVLVELVIPNSAGITLGNAGDLGIETTVASTSLSFNAAGTQYYLYPTLEPAFNFASSTLAYEGKYGASGTTTLVLANYLEPTTLYRYFCKTDVGTAYVDFAYGSGGASTTAMQCTTSGVDVTPGSNNTGTFRQDLKVDIGTSASSPNNIIITATIIRKR